MKKYKWIIILLNLVLLLLYFNYSVIEKEQLLKNGRLVLLELTPVDPRSLMQGDYMALRYKITDSITQELPKRGYCVVRLDSDGITECIRFQTNATPLHEAEYLIEFNASSNRNISIGAESFFFQEDEAAKYDNAKYGGLRIDLHGNSLLTGLYNQQGQLIQ